MIALFAILAAIKQAFGANQSCNAGAGSKEAISPCICSGSLAVLFILFAPHPSVLR
jgi:hypothetical protein